MRIPLWIVIFLPKSTQEKSMQGRWDDKTDDEIIYAYKNNADWQKMWKGFMKPQSDVTLNAIKKGKERLETYILPQVVKRGLVIAPPIGRSYLQDGDW